MSEKDRKEVPSTSADNGISTSSNVKHPARSSRICKKCSRSVQNLSRHQQKVHGMSKMRRKLHGYLTGEKKAPNRRVKFCPLSPCKRSKTPIFQIGKHLQSGIHKLKPKTPAYVQALAQAPRASLSNVDSYLKRQRKQRAQKNEKVTSDKRNYKGNVNEDYDACDEADNSKGKNVKCNPEDSDMDNDQDYEELGRRAQRKIRKREIARENKRSNEDSDEEYDRLARKVWKKKKNKNRITSDSNSDYLLDGSDEEYIKLVSEGLNEECQGDIMESNNSEGSNNDADDKCEEIYNEEESTNSFNKNEDLVECVEISDSEESRTLDPDYLCTEVSDSDTSSQPDTSIASSSLTEECEGLLTELIEVIGEKKISEGSFLDEEQDWSETVKEFKVRRLAQEHVFKSTRESAEELARVNEESMHEAFHEALDEDESDNDEALDTNWVPSDCEINENENIKTKGQARSEDVVTGTVLTEFYEWLTDVDGGYRSEKMAQQYKSQVLSVIRRLQMNETIVRQDSRKPSMYLLLFPDKEGVTLLKQWLSYAVSKYQPGTVRSYLMSLRLFYKFLTQERKPNMPDVSADTLNARRDLMSSWSSAQKKKVLRRKLQRNEEDFKKLITSENLYQICHGGQRINAVKQLGNSSKETREGTEVQRIISERTHCEVRDWLMTRLVIDNSGRSGVIANMTVTEFKAAVFHPGTDEDQARYRILVSNHKTADQYGSAVIWAYDDLFKLMDIYLRNVRSQFTAASPEVKQLFVSSNGMPLTSSQVSTSVWRTFQREGIVTEGRISATIVRKSLATGMHVHLPAEKDHLAALAQHKTLTQARYYRVHDKLVETDLGRRAVRKLVAIKSSSIHKAQGDLKDTRAAPKPWKTVETEKLKELFKEDLETGAIDEAKVKEKLSTETLLEERPLKAVVLKLRRLREEYMEDCEPPSDIESSEAKVKRYLDSAEPEAAPSSITHISGSVSAESSRFWRKFTEEQANHLFKVTKDLIEGDAIKKEIVWQRVKGDKR